MAEGGHWYTHEGVLVLEVPMATKPGQVKAPTLREARKLGLLPSVTTVLQVLDKPGLRQWFVDRAVRMALEHPKYYSMEPDGVAAVLEDADAYRNLAADFGTKVHAGIAGRIEGHPIEIEPEVDEVVEALAEWCRGVGLEITQSEHSFVSPLGYAGTIDMIGTFNGQPCIADLKTQDFEVHTDVNYYDEHALQLSGYALGTGQEDKLRVSVIASRSTPGLVVAKVWKDFEKFDRAWLSLWEFWKHLKAYYPEVPSLPTNVVDLDAYRQRAGP